MLYTVAHILAVLAGVAELILGIWSLATSAARSGVGSSLGIYCIIVGCVILAVECNTCCVVPTIIRGIAWILLSIFGFVDSMFAFWIGSILLLVSGILYVVDGVLHGC
jgi:hypothetical protein